MMDTTNDENELIMQILLTFPKIPKALLPTITLLDKKSGSSLRLPVRVMVAVCINGEISEPMIRWEFGPRIRIFIM